MLGSIVVALITVSLLLTGVYLGNTQNRVEEESLEVETYNEGFFGSLDNLVGGLQQSAERGEATREDKYQEYLKVQDKQQEATIRFQSSVPKVYQAPATTVVVPQVQFQATVPANTPMQTTNDQDGKLDLGGDVDSIGSGLLLDFDIGDIDF